MSPLHKKARARVLKPSLLRFANGLRRIDEPALVDPQEPPPQLTVIHVDVVRPADLVSLSVDAVGCELLSDGAQPAHLRPVADSPSAYLVVRFAFQHVGEAAVYEGQSGPNVFYNEWNPEKPLTGIGPPNAPDARALPPIDIRAARGTRLVFDIPASERIEFSTAGILAAMGRLRLRVHPLATPGGAPLRGMSDVAKEIVEVGDFLPILVGDQIARFTAHGVSLQRASRQELRALGAPPVDTPAGAIFRAAESRRARVLLSTRSSMAEGAASIRDIAGLVIGAGRLPGRLRISGIHSHPPADDETSIEAPYRLIISPSVEARWAHANAPVTAADEYRHVELWHSRLATVATSADGSTFTDEKNRTRRIVRALWTRDRDSMAEADWKDPQKNEPEHSDSPFRMSLDPADRQMLVQQSSETLRVGARTIAPVPVAAHALWLSSLGAWLDLHGAWNTKPYSAASLRSILAWDHLAPMGRDQYVRVVYPGYLYPWGHQAALVKVTERKMRDASPSVAGLYQRQFLVIGEARRVYANSYDPVHGAPRDLPFVEAVIRPSMTPPLDPGADPDKFFWPVVGSQAFQFIVDLLDHAGRPSRLQMPLLWVAESYLGFHDVDVEYGGSPDREVAAYGQSIAFAPSVKGGDTQLAADRLRFLGKAAFGTSTPRLSSADVRIPAVEALSPVAKATPIAYHPVYKSRGFDAAVNRNEAWAGVLVSGELDGSAEDASSAGDLPVLKFGAGASSASDRAGGFLIPNIPIRTLSRSAGIEGNADAATSQTVQAREFFKGAFPKLFGLIDLSDLLTVDSDLLRMPKVIGEFIGRIEALITEVARAGQAIGDALAEAKAMLESATDKDVAAMIQQAQDAVDAATSVQSYVEQLGETMGQLLKFAEENGGSNAAESAAKMFAELGDKVTTGLEDLADKLPPFMGGVLRSIAKGLGTFVGDATKLALDVANYLNGIAESGALARVRFEWKPTLSSWPAGQPLLELKPDSLVLAVQTQVGLKGTPTSYASAELRDFTLHLFPNAELISLSFSRFAFVVAGGGKPEVDIVFTDIGFHGVLSFVEDLKTLIPLDGFSDPPYVKVESGGLTAGFDVALPNLAIGVFAITNLSLGADVNVPFLGKAMTIGFNFCTREHPFTMAVAFIGGGGWAGIRASAQGLEVLEVGLEAGACVAVDLGVASGSVSAMLGVYIRLETDEGSITGYFRLRGEVDVLGLVSAAIELYMALAYQPTPGKLTGEATISVNVSVMGLSKSVTITARRTFAGSNGDPSFLEVMGIDGAARSSAWDAYCAAFMAEG
jgi:hypothetical protein